MRVLSGVAALSFWLLAGCSERAEVEPVVAASRDRVDVHTHLVDDAVDELLATLDRHAIAAAVVLASPHLDHAHPPEDSSRPFSGWRAANDRLLRLTADHRDRLVPFVTVDPAELAAGELESWLERGACGVKIYAGHRSLHARALDDPRHAETFALLERRRVPVLLHVNSVRYEAELDRLLRRYPELELVCAHLCGSRTDLDRLARILAKHPSLRVDTSHGPGLPGIAGFANLDRERDRLRAMILAEPERFLFGSDLVTSPDRDRATTRAQWDRQVAANLGLLERDRFEFWRAGEQHGTLELGSLRGLGLDDPTLHAVLAGNARAWLRGCPATASR